MKGKIINFLAIISWVAYFILLLKVEDRFWLGFITGIAICLTVIALIKMIYNIEKTK